MINLIKLLAIIYSNIIVVIIFLPRLLTPNQLGANRRQKSALFDMACVLMLMPVLCDTLKFAPLRCSQEAFVWHTHTLSVSFRSSYR